MGVIVSRRPLLFSELHPNLRDSYPSLGTFPTHMPVFLACKAQCFPDASVMFFLGHPSVLAVQFHRHGPHVGGSRGRAGDGRWGSSCGWDKCRLQVKSGFRLCLHRGRCDTGPHFLFLLDLPCLKAHVQSGCSVLQFLEGSPFLLSHQKVLDHVLQSSVKVWGQCIAIQLRVLAMAVTGVSLSLVFHQVTAL